MKHNLGEILNMLCNHAIILIYLFLKLCVELLFFFLIPNLILCRAYNGRNETKSGTGKREVSV